MRSDAVSDCNSKPHAETLEQQAIRLERQAVAASAAREERRKRAEEIRAREFEASRQMAVALRHALGRLGLKAAMPCVGPLLGPPPGGPSRWVVVYRRARRQVGDYVYPDGIEGEIVRFGVVWNEDCTLARLTFDEEEVDDAVILGRVLDGLEAVPDDQGDPRDDGIPF
jgi:hypothetical protein